MNVKKTKIIKEDGRYLIYYTFVDERKVQPPPSSDSDQADGVPSGKTRPPADA